MEENAQTVDIKSINEKIEKQALLLTYLHWKSIRLLLVKNMIERVF